MANRHPKQKIPAVLFLQPGFSIVISPLFHYPFLNITHFRVKVLYFKLRLYRIGVRIKGKQKFNDRIVCKMIAIIVLPQSIAQFTISQLLCIRQFMQFNFQIIMQSFSETPQRSTYCFRIEMSSRLFKSLNTLTLPNFVTPVKNAN